MTQVVFLGPSLPRATAETLLPSGHGTRYLPPARQGDLADAVERHGASSVLLVDGVFHGPPSVWHREILWALDRGVRVLGAASMGALRAVECAAFGMEPVGRIAEAFRTGCFAGCWDQAFEDDDEVAVLHGPEATSFLALSDAMVDLRATLAEAVSSGIVELNEARILAAKLKARPFAERSFAALRSLALERSQPGFASWLPQGRVRAKAEDTAEALRLLASDAARPPSIPFRFEQALVWTRRERAGSAETTLDPREAAAIARLALDPKRFRAVAVQALALLAAQGLAVDKRAALGSFRLRRDLGTRERLEAWCHAAGINGGHVQAIALDEARLDALLDAPPPGFARALLASHLLDGGSLDPLEAPVASGEDGPRLLAPLLWYFEERQRTAIPADLDRHAATLGFADATAFATTVANLFAEETAVRA